jgi:nucleoside-diphosphate-sugar epimerase/glycosyltransferase involved in cell wall biosynthesis
MRILVTGANGFVGKALCRYLSQCGHEVRRAVRVQDGLTNTVELNETTSATAIEEALRGMECIVHLAGRAHFLGRINPAKEAAYKETNVKFTQRLALLAHRAGVRRFVFVSSIKVCGEESRFGPLTEKAIPSPLDIYAISKWEAEQALRNVEKETGLEVVIIRPALVYGEGVKANFLKLLSAVYRGIPLPFSLLTNKRSFIYLQNLVTALSACALDARAAGATFHVSDAKSLSLPHLVNELARAMGYKARVFPCPKWLLVVLGKVTGKQQQVGSLVNNLEVDSTRIRTLLEWSPTVSFEQGIQKTVDWFLQRDGTNSPFREADARKAGLKVCQLCAVDFTLKHLLLPLVDGMQDKGWHVTSVCSEGKYAQELRLQGYRHVPISISRNIFDIFSHVRTTVLLYKLFRRERFDVLHVHTPIAALLGRIAGRLAKIPLIVYTAHGFYFHDAMPKLTYRFYVSLEKLSGYCTDLLFTQSSEDAKVAVTEGIAKSNNVIDIGNGVSAELFEPATQERKLRVRKALNVPEDAYVVGVVSRLVKEKGLVEFLEAAAELGQVFPKVQFILVGERLSSDHNASIERELQAAQIRLDTRLMAVGYRADVADLLGAMDVFCLPSYREGMPRSIIEAMMMALPVVATNIRGSREEVVAERTGLLVPVRSSTAIVQALGRLITNPELARQMGQLGRQRALELYDERRIVARQIDIISARCIHV